MITFPLHQFQLDFLNTTRPEQLLAGGSGIGKSYVAALKLIRYALSRPGSEAMVGAATWENTIKLMVPALLLFLKQIDESLWKYEIGYNRIVFANGSIIHIKNLQEPGRLKGFNLDLVWIDEGTEVRELAEIYEQLQNRLRSAHPDYPKQLIVTTNPGLKSGFLYKRFYEAYEPERMWRKSLPAYAGRHLPQEFLERLERLSSHRRKLLLAGEWGSQEGQAFELDYGVHIRDDEPPQSARYFVTYDYGFDPDPLVFLLCAIWGGRVYVQRELELKRVLIGEPLRPYLESLVEGVKVEGFTGETFPPALDWLKRGMGWRHYLTSKDRYKGWLRLQDYVQRRYEDTGTAGIIIHPRCKRLIESVESLVWSDGKRDVAPGDDHHADALRYLVMSNILWEANRGTVAPTHSYA